MSTSNRPQPSPAVQSSPALQRPGAAHPSAARQGAGKQSAERAKPATIDDEDDEPSPPVTDLAIKAAPPWLVSLVFHLVAFIILALWYQAPWRTNRLNLEMVVTDEQGQQMLEKLDSFTLDPLENTEAVFTQDDEPVEDPLAAPLEVPIKVPDALKASSNVDAPKIGNALSGRVKGQKKVLLQAYGGSEDTEAAVRRGLAWLKRYQRRDGSWSLMGPYRNGSTRENRVAATAMALLAFQGAGNTHESGEYQPQVARGWKFLLKQIDADGNFFQSGPEHHRLYSQAQATIAICELCGMTQDRTIRKPAQDAINYAVKIQSEEGGWRYTPGSDTDTSVTGWFVMALQSAKMAGLHVPTPTLTRIEDYLDIVTTDGGSKYAYQVNRGSRISMTAEALLCRQYLGWERDDPRLIRGVKVVLRNPIDWDEANTYYWYYATQVVHHMEGQMWHDWNQVLRKEIPRVQITRGKESGSWSPLGDRWGLQGGRLYQTCLCIYMLEVYYRHLPIYKYRLKNGKR